MTGARRRRLPRLDAVAQQLSHFNRLQFKKLAPGIGAGQRQQVLDQHGQFFSFVQNVPQCFPISIGVSLSSQCHFGLGAHQ